MKLKQTILSMVLLFGFISFIFTPIAYSASCGGVKTSIISCGEKGVCKDGSDPYEGADPGKNKEAKKNYKNKYHHEYGKCKDGSDPSTNPSDTGLWGLLLLAINILTAGVGIAAVGGIVVGSYMYMTAGGSPDRVKKANVFLSNVVLGIIVYAAMFAFLNFIIPGGLFS